MQLKILFICTHNRCRSILCEAIANDNHQGVLLAKSAGSSPSGEVHPMTLDNLQKQGHSIDGLYSKSWDELQNFNADIVITVCDSANNESCPVWFEAGNTIKAHWALPDPSKIEDENLSCKAFVDVIKTIQHRLDSLANITNHVDKKIDKQTLAEQLRALGATV